MPVLVADIGGTHTRLGLAQRESGRIRLFHLRDYASRNYPDFDSVLEDFRRGIAEDEIEAACFAVAGPVADQQARITNLPWQLDAGELRQCLLLERLSLLNDFQAIAHGLAEVNEDRLVTLQTGEPRPQGVRALMGAGTGLGIAYLVRVNDAWLPCPTEGGHAGFAPADEIQRRLLSCLQSSLDYVAYEHLLSGAGLQRLYRFFLDEVKTPSALREAILQAADPAAEISRHALRGEDAAAVQALECFVRIYGAQAGNVALNYLPFGGLYIAGGIAPKIIDWMSSPRFLQAFHDKGVMSDLMPRFPVQVVMEERAGLLGAAAFALRSLVE